MDVSKVLLALVLATIHISVINRLEKSLTQVIWESPSWTRRPSKECNKRNIPLQTQCYGMPSGHAEFAVIFFTLLYLWNIVSLPLAAIAILLIGLQRIVWNRHTISQVVIGSLLGLVYCTAYFTAYKIHPSIAMMGCVIFVLIICLVSVIIISRKQIHTPLPRWVHPSLYGLIQKKQTDTSLQSKLLYYLGHIIIDSDYGYLTWNDLEHLLDQMISGLETQPDLVIGIKTGGGILAGYISKRLNKPLDFIRTKRSIYNCSSNVQSGVEAMKYALDSETKSNQEYQVCEKPVRSVKGKNVLLIDETAYSGGTIKSSKEYLLNMGAQKVDVLVVSAIKNRQLYKYIYGKGVVAWPWSFDN